ncbi:MAG TPA: lysophospholipid acyltransferase family protein [Phycisphaerae bacterium]|nr:lysophospholipid acyltransferase family protein [Phycisphaerae bacterium]HRW54024.1 lysophospholipid acyltransferase family protein [Phycisphaerae bacterium]
MANTTPSSSSKPLRERLRHAYLQHVIAPGLRLSGPGLTDRLARRVGRGVYRLGPPIRQIAMSNATRALGDIYSPASIRRIVEASFEHAARFWGESLFIQQRLAHQDWRKHVSLGSTGSDDAAADSFPATFERIRSQGRGLILTTAYLGNPAIAAVTWGRMLGRIHVVADFDNQPMIKAWRTDLEGLPCIEIIERSEALSVVPRILRNGGTIFTIGEHTRYGRKGVPVRWLGRDIRAYRTIGLLAARYDAVVLPIACTRQSGPFSFDMRIEQSIDPRALRQEPDEIVRTMIASLETAVMRAPEQYLWATWNAVAARASTERAPTAAKDPRFESGVGQTLRR